MIASLNCHANFGIHCNDIESMINSQSLTRCFFSHSLSLPSSLSFPLSLYTTTTTTITILLTPLLYCSHSSFSYRPFFFPSHSLVLTLPLIICISFLINIPQYIGGSLNLLHSKLCSLLTLT